MIRYLIVILLDLTILFPHALAAAPPSPLLSRISGHEGPFRTLILIQDPAIRRGTGGQILYGIEILMDQGELITKRVLNRDQLNRTTAQSPPPYEISRFANTLSLANANYFLDPAKSGALITKLWKEQFGSSLQMVVFLSTMALERMINDETTENPSEKNLASKEQKMADFWTLKLEKGQLFTDIKPFVEEKQGVFFSPDAQLQGLLQETGFSTGLPQALKKNEDFLMLATLNQEERPVEGLREYAALFTFVKNDGRIINRLRIARSSDRSAMLPFRSITRILIPEGSTVAKTRGIDRSALIFLKHSPFLVLSYERTLNPGEREETEIFYELPFRFDVNGVDRYKLQLSKQIGTFPMLMKWQVKIPSSMSIFEQSEKNPFFTFEKDRVLEFTAGKKPGN